MRVPRLVAFVVPIVLHVAGAALHAEELHVVATSPVRHAFGAPGTAISVTFDRTLLRSSITQTSLRIFGRASGPVRGAIGFTDADHTVTIAPSHALSAGETVLVNLSHDIRAADSTPLRAAGFAYEFVVATKPATRAFQQISEFSNRSDEPTRIYGALGTDFDGDGWIDLGTVNEDSADVRVFLNRADGSGLFQTFLPPVPVGAEASPNEPADVDNDGNTDAVVSATDGPGIWVLHGRGDGTFGESQTILTASEPHGVAVLDVDGDGDLDIVEALYVGPTSGGAMALMRNDGTGHFGAPTFFDSSCKGEWGLGSGDLDNDGITDLVVGCVTDDAVSVMLGNGDGTFTLLPAQNAGGAPWQVAIGDVDGDGVLDAALALADVGGGLLRGHGDGTFAPVVTYDAPSSPSITPSSKLGDLDGDGDLDWVLTNFNVGVWRVYQNDRTGTFTFDQDVTATANPSCAVLLDIDNDGALDMALSDEVADTVKIMRNERLPSALCPATPATCRMPVVAGKASLLMRDKVPDDGDQVVWRWVKGPATSLSEYGQPLTTDGYALCLYDAGVLIAALDADAGGICGGRPCWSANSRALKYKSRDGSTTGTRSIVLKEGLTDGTAQIVYRAKGVKVVLPNLAALTGPVDVQLHHGGGAPCFGATYGAPFQSSDGTIFKARAN